MNSLVVFTLLAVALQSVAGDNPMCRLCAYKSTGDGDFAQDFCANLGFGKFQKPDLSACCDKRCLTMDENDDDWPVECQSDDEERCFSVELVDEDDNVLAANRGNTEKNSLLESWRDLQVGEDQRILTKTCKKDFCNGATAINAAMVIPALIFSYVMFLKN